MKKFAIAVISLVLAVCQSAMADDGLVETFHTVKLSRGVDLNIIVSKRQSATPDIAALLFAGYPGILKIKNEDGNFTYDLKGNFLIRARRHLNTDKVFTVMVDCPKDQWNFCDDRYRTSEQHVTDVTEVISYVKQNFDAKQTYIVGTSYGTVSSANLAKGLGDKIDGAVHTATMTQPKYGHGTSMWSFDWSKAKAPQLFVHHKYDPCDTTRYSDIVDRKKDIPLITVDGSSGSRGDACRALSPHGFVGREKAVMRAIGDWIVNRKVTAMVNEDNL